MRQRYYWPGFRAMAFLLPCAVVGLIGYQWLRLEREAQARRSREAAQGEAARLRNALAARLGEATAEAARNWDRRPVHEPPFAPPPPLPDLVAAAHLFGPDGKLLYPNYEAAYSQAISDYESANVPAGWRAAIERAEALEARGQVPEAQRVLQALGPPARHPGLRARVLLALGRLSLAAGQYRTAEAHAAGILECCALARDEYGVPFVLYAAAQLMDAWERRAEQRRKFPQLALRLGELLRRGIIGHPSDLDHVLALARRAGGDPAAIALSREAGNAAGRIRRQSESGSRLEVWIQGSVLPARGSPSFAVFTTWSDGQPQLAGVYRAGETGLLVTLFATDRLAEWIAARAAEKGRFDALLLRPGEMQGTAVLREVLFPEAPGFQLALRAREADAWAQPRRQALFAGVLAAALLLILLAGYFALRDASRELKTAALRSSFIAGVSHELKTPLTSIRLLVETLRLRRTRDDGAAEELLSAIADETGRLTHLIENVLSFARVEKGAHQYRPVEIRLGEAVRGAIDRFQCILRQGGFRLLQETDGGELRVYADAEGLAQALLNLLSNAVKYSGRSREIRLEVHGHGGTAEIRIVDFGIGIPRSEQQRIFDSFYRAPEAARETAGAGLGLALVRHFAEAHHGRVTVSSEPGKGSAFSLWLPLVKDDGQDSHR